MLKNRYQTHRRIGKKHKSHEIFPLMHDQNQKPPEPGTRLEKKTTIFFVVVRMASPAPFNPSASTSIMVISLPPTLSLFPLCARGVAGRGIRRMVPALKNLHLLLFFSPEKCQYLIIRSKNILICEKKAKGERRIRTV